jgi:hypothetical protein
MRLTKHCFYLSRAQAVKMAATVFSRGHPVFLFTAAKSKPKTLKPNKTPVTTLTAIVLK